MKEEYSTNPIALKSRKRYNKLTREKKLSWSRVRNNKLAEKFSSDPTYRALYLERQKEASDRSKAKISEGLCKAAIKCGKPKLETSVYCLHHWIRSIARAYLSNKNRQQCFKLEEVIALWNNQNGLCALTGIQLIPGKTASLDHIVPVSKGGTNDISNLRFVHTHINLFKKDMLDNEFQQLIQDICPKLLEWSNIEKEFSDVVLNNNEICYLFQGN